MRLVAKGDDDCPLAAKAREALAEYDSVDKLAATSGGGG